MKRQGPSEAHLDLLQEYEKEQKKARKELDAEPLESNQQAHRPSFAGQAAFSDDEGDEWDDVDLGGEEEDEQPIPVVGDVQISFAKPVKKESVPRSFKLQVHASCLALLLAHTRIRNIWAMDATLWAALRDQMPSIFLQQLVPPRHLSDTLKTKSLLSGLRQLSNWWAQGFAINSVGLYSVGWADMSDKNRDVRGEVSKAEFVHGITSRFGSRDELAQGLCALVRAHRLECRLVCSLQPPDFNSSKSSSFTSNSPPIYWVEVWDPFSNAWITVDPLTQTVEVTRHSSALEPLQSDSRNIMRYVIAWNQNGSCRDVTRRYSSKYNARTRKRRMDYFPRYRDMYNQWMLKFSKLDLRDVQELKLLNKWERNEGMPQRVQDFVGHPYYALEHQLKKVEILDTRAPCGTLKIGQEVVPVYPRRDVKTCRSAQTWYRVGRTLKQQQQPKLYRTKRDKLGDEEQVALYSEDQTELYVPPPVVDGVVPKSEFRTIDIFVPSMLPQGAVHLNHPLAQRAAKALGADYANAVVAVNFDRSGPKSKFAGIVVAREVRGGVIAAIKELLKLARYEAKLEQRQKVLYLWKQVFVAAQIRRRIDGDFENIRDDEEWPTLVPAFNDQVSESESESEPATELAGQAPSHSHSQAQTSTRMEPTIKTEDNPAHRVPIVDLVHSNPPPEPQQQPNPQPSSDSEEHDVFLDGLNESDFDV